MSAKRFAIVAWASRVRRNVHWASERSLYACGIEVRVYVWPGKAVFQWLRAARSDPEHRPVALTYAIGIVVVQVLWVLRLLVPDDLAVPSFFVLVAAELAIPFLGERRRMTPFHTGHIAERFGLLTLITLGEVIAGTVAAVGALVGEQGWSVAAVAIVAVSSFQRLASRRATTTTSSIWAVRMRICC